MKNKILLKNDFKHIWHPCTQQKDYIEGQIPLIPIKKGKGIYVYDFKGKQYIDCISSWWVNIFGHSNDYINKKLNKQLNKIEHIIFAGFTHKPIIKLSKRIIKLAPKGLKKCFFADNGSSAIEAALKMSFHCFKNKGETRNTFLSLNNGYHGETIGALSVSGTKLYKDIYKDILIKNAQVSAPLGMTKKSAQKCAKELETYLKKHHKTISSFIIEPLVQCAGGMNMYHPIYLQKAKELCATYNIHLIADEIAVGFGRSGKMFACEHANISPDFMCLSKGLSGGYLPISMVLTTQKIYDSFYDDYFTNKAFLHSHSYTGNILACTAANATLDIFKQKNILQKNAPKIDFIQKNAQQLSKHKLVKNIRQTGMIMAFDIAGFKKEERIGITFYKKALQKGLILRPLGDTIYLMPPFIIKKKELKYIFVAIKNILDDIK